MSNLNIIENNNSISFINTYNDDNPILEIGDECYFIFFNSVDYHIPLIGRGTIIYDRFNDTINKHYFISLKEILEKKSIKDKFIEDIQLTLFPFNKETLNVSTKAKYIKYNSKLDFSFFDKNLFKIEAFFIRKGIEEIINLRNEYSKIILSDLNKQIKEVQEILI